jgi:hypothetical protein
MKMDRQALAGFKGFDPQIFSFIHHFHSKEKNMARRLISVSIFLGMLVLGLLLASSRSAFALTVTPTGTGSIGFRTISGSVKDSVTGLPIAGATVTCVHHVLVSHSPLCTGTRTTGSDGLYSFGSVLIRDTDLVSVTVDATGYTSQTISKDGISFLGGGSFNFALVAATITSTPTNTAAPTLSGYVRVGSSTGPGLANVNVCYYLAAYDFDCVNHNVLTDQNGRYQMSICVPQQENVTIQASLSGYTFSPAAYYSTQYIGCKTGTYDFVATATGGTPGTLTKTPTVTKTRTPTPTYDITITRTPTPTISTGACSPVNATITSPFTWDGAGTFCWQAATLGTYINSWSIASLKVNGVNLTNMYVTVAALPAKIGGYWYISYNSAVAWGHFEAK